MTVRQGIRVTSSTSGSPSPGVEHLSGGYRYQGIPGWNPAAGVHGEGGAPDHRETNAGAQARVQGKAERFRAFCDLRARGVSVLGAAADMRVNVQPKTARKYEAERLAARNGAAR